MSSSNQVEFFFQAGRLLLRKAISETLRMPYKDIKLARTEKGKPFISSAIPSAFQNFSFNVSHQGEFTVLATNLRGPVGVDVMNIERPSEFRYFSHFTMRGRVGGAEVSLCITNSQP